MNYLAESELSAEKHGQQLANATCT